MYMFRIVVLYTQNLDGNFRFDIVGRYVILKKAL